MRMFFGVALLALGLVAMPVVAGADPIGPNECGTEVYQCHLYADYEIDGASAVASPAPYNGYLVAYTFLLNQAADLSDGFQESDVAHILVIHDALFELFSKSTIVLNTAFDTAFAAAIALTAIDNTILPVGQIQGCPAIEGGVPSLGGIGYCTTADEVSFLVNWGFPNGDAGADLLTIHTALPPDDEEEPPTRVPEPGTLSLLGLGFASLALRRRKTAL